MDNGQELVQEEQTSDQCDRCLHFLEELRNTERLRRQLQDSWNEDTLERGLRVQDEAEERSFRLEMEGLDANRNWILDLLANHQRTEHTSF